MDSVYLETTFISYLVSLPARDLLVAAHQQVTRDWWHKRRNSFRCVISQVVIDEISAGDMTEATKRLKTVETLDVLKASIFAEALTQSILEAGVLPKKAAADAAHIALAAVHGIQYMLTWNCKHLANAQNARQLERICEMNGLAMPLICTPEVLLQGRNDD